jgi:hypothetical protein
MSPNYIQAACHCRPLKMCPFCKRWLKPQAPAKRKAGTDD